MRCHSSLPILGLLLLSIALSFLLQYGQAGASWFQSPVSPLPPFAMPVVPTPPGPPTHILPSIFRTSPLPWIAVGLVVFGALAWALIALFSRLQARDT
jgi:hypothetical protein